MELELDEIVDKRKQDLETGKGYRFDELKDKLMAQGDDIAADVSDQVRCAANDVLEGTTSQLREFHMRVLGRLIDWKVTRQLGRENGCCRRSGSRLKGVIKGKGGRRTSDQPLDK